jgi:hypothetical protein
MRRLYPLFFLLFICGTVARSQQYCNSWINYSQKYYKFSIINDGVYRIDSLALANSGIDLSSIDPRNFQIFGRGQQVPLYVHGESDGVMNDTDYIEFYAKHNDGFLDSLLYDTASNPNPYYSLINDTATYFLTWNNSVNNQRLQLISDTAFSSFTPVNFFFKNDVNFTPQYNYFGPTSFIGSTDPQYTSSEGWGDNPFAENSSVSYNFNTSKIYNAGPPSQLEFCAVGASTQFGPIDHELKVECQNPSVILTVDTFFAGYRQVRSTRGLLSSQLSTSTTVVYTSVNSFNWSNRTGVMFTRLKYPHTVDMEGQSNFTFYLPDNGGPGTSFLDIGNFNANASPVYLYDLTNSKRIEVFANGPGFRVKVPDAGNEKKCFLTSQSQMLNITLLKPVTPTGQFTDFSTQNFDSAFIIITHKSLMNEAKQYGLYRNTGTSESQNTFNVVIADVEELYDQFAYGIRKHPLAIKHFAKFAIDTANVSPPRDLFLIGKAISVIECRNPYWNGSYVANYASCLVPSMGYPPTDNYFTAGLRGNALMPGIPTGRLAAKTPQEVLDYLQKVQTYEALTAAEWMKHIIHFGGGADANEQLYIRNCLNGYKNLIEGPSYGGTVFSFYKDNSQPIQLTLSDSVRYLINNGVSLMTFFGHASGNSFDQNIDYPSNYNNIGKCPLVLANSCFTGDIHEPVGLNQSSASEEWILIPQKGAIGFIASISKTSISALCNYSNEFYNNISVNNYGRSIGYCMQQTIVTTQQNNTDPLTNQACLEMSLHGDPSIHLHTHNLPDYSIADSSIFFTPQTVTTAQDSFEVNVVITNIGKAQNDTVQVELTRHFPNGSTSVYSASKTGIWYRDTVRFHIPTDKILGPGLNKFEVRVDPFFRIQELNEMNNDVVAPTFAYLDIFSGDIVPIYPYNYAIIPTDTITLKASTGDPFAAPSKYEFEIDTTDLYNSPFKQTYTVNSAPGGVISWKPNITFTDSMVYFWHVRKDPALSRNSGWKEFSFQYIPGKNGWAQAHFFQFKHDDLSFLDYNRNQRTFDFVTSGKTLLCDVYGQPLPNFNLTQLYGCEYKLDLTIEDYGGCGLTPAMHVVIIDPLTLQPWGTRHLDASGNDTINATHAFGNANDLPPNQNGCGRVSHPDLYFIFRTNNAQQLQGMRTMLQDSVPNGYYILIYSWLQGKFQSWADPTVRDFIRDSLGASNISSLPDTVPYIYYCVKGDTSTGIEMFGDSADQFLRLTKNLTGSNNYGTVVSELFGPAKSWDSLSWHELPLQNDPAGDSTTLDIIGVNAGGVETTVRSGLPVDSFNIYLHSINASTFPYMKLRANLHDDSLYTAPQLKKWQVFYQPSPEVAVNPPVYFSFLNDTVQEGDSIKFKVAVTNVSPFNMDSMLVTYWIIDRNRVTHYLPSYISDTLPAYRSLITSIKFPTAGYPGLNSVWMEINPINHGDTTRNEEYHFNNLAQVGYFVGTDRINPLLDVTFDGVHIMNGDIVSAKPNILVQVKDENRFLALNDTTVFQLFLKTPSQQIAQRIYFRDLTCAGQLCFHPASLPNNSCKINYTPDFTQDGIYEIIIQAKDRSSNLSGNVDYRITFEVVNKPSITELLNWPNPFSTATHFVFTLTGSEVPDFLKIQILTVSGRVVREIDKNELGPLHIGRNITDYAWDGRDDFGDKLANGVYIYRVLTQLNGSSLDIRETSADQFFKQGFGKMVIIR